MILKVKIMADKSRSIQTKFWYDTWIETLNMSEKLLYLYFLTNPLTNLLGVYEISLKRISNESGISKDTIQKALKRFERDSRIIYDDNFIIITKFLKNQKLNPNMQLNVESLFDALPKCLRNKILNNGLEGFESIRNGLLKLKGKEKGKLKLKREIETKKEYDSAIKDIVIEYYEFQYQRDPLQLKEWITNKENLINDSCDVIDKLQRLDGFMLDDIKLILKNATKDIFWKKVIISLRGLRDKSKNGQTKFQNAAAKLLKKDAFDEWEAKYGKN